MDRSAFRGSVQGRQRPSIAWGAASHSTQKNGSRAFAGGFLASGRMGGGRSWPGRLNARSVRHRSLRTNLHIGAVRSVYRLQRARAQLLVASRKRLRMPYFEIVYSEELTSKALSSGKVAARDRREAAVAALNGFANAEATHGAKCFRVVDGSGMVVARGPKSVEARK